MENRKKLTEIVGGASSWLNNNWDNIPPAPDYGNPVPSGRYSAHLKEVRPFQAKTGTPGLKLVFEIIEGEYKGRLCWYDIWLTAAAKSQAVRDFAKLGVKNRAQLDQPVPRWLRCQIRVVIHRSDEGDEFNRVKAFEVIGVDKPETDPFAGDDIEEGGQTV